MKEETVVKHIIIYRFSLIIAVMLINALYKGVKLSTCVVQLNFGEYFATILKQIPNFYNVIRMIPVFNSLNKMLEYKLFEILALI